MGKRFEGLREARHPALLGATLLAALAIRIAVLNELGGTIYAAGLLPDENIYHRWAVQLAAGQAHAGFAGDFPRLPALIFGLVYSAFGVSALHLRVLNVVLGVATCGLAYVTGRSLYDRQVGLVSALLCAFSESLALYSATVLNTALGLFLFAALLALQAALLRRPDSHAVKKALGIGALSGLLVNARGNAAIVGLLAVPIAYLAKRERSASSKAALRALSPWLGALAAAYLLCAAATGGVLGPRSAFNLYFGNNPDNPTPYYRPVRFTSSEPERQAIGFIAEGSRRAGRELSAGEAERFWASTVLRHALARPGAFARRLGQKALAVLNRSPSDNDHDLRLFRELLPALRLAFLPTWLLLALGLALGCVLPFDRRLAYGAAAAGLYAATLLVFFTGERLRSPLILVAAPYAAAGLVQLARGWGSERRRAWLRAAAALAVLLLISGVRLEGAQDLSSVYNLHALTLFQAGDLPGAQRWYLRSLSLHGRDSPGARIGLAAILHQRGELEQAEAVLDAMPDDYYEAASKYEWLGNMELERRHAAAAASAYEKSLAIDSSRQNAYKGLYIAYRLEGNRKAAADADERLQRIESLR